MRTLLAPAFPPTAEQTNPGPASHEASPPGRHPGETPSPPPTGARGPAHKRSGAKSRTGAGGSPSQRPASWPPPRPHPSHPEALPLFARSRRSGLPDVRSYLRGTGVSEPAPYRPRRSPAPTHGPPAPRLRTRPRASASPSLCRTLPPPPRCPALPCPAHPRALGPSSTVPFPEPQRPPCTPLPRVRLPAPPLSLSLSPARLLLTTRQTRGAAERGLPLQPLPPRLEVPPPAAPPLPAPPRPEMAPQPRRARRRRRARARPGPGQRPASPPGTPPRAPPAGQTEASTRALGGGGATRWRQRVRNFSLRLDISYENELPGHIWSFGGPGESACRALYRLIQGNHSKCVFRQTFGILIGDSEICPFSLHFQVK